ncbi:hypothetical protein KI387_017650, partial [Taxus chinensis]
MEGGERAWQDNLPEDLMLIILTLLPIQSQVQMRSVCKRWKKLLCTREFQELHKTMPPSSTPAFCIQVGGGQLWVIMHELNSTDAVYKLPSMPMMMAETQQHNISSRRIMLAGSSICCSWSNKKMWKYTVFFLCNPATASWRILPCPSHKFDFHVDSLFCAIGFPASKCNTWGDPIHLSFDMEKDVWPVGRGVYSQGRFYWPNDGTGCGQVLELSVGESAHFTKLPFPIDNLREDDANRSFHNEFSHLDSIFPWKLTGTDGKVVLVNVLLHSMWMLTKETRGEDRIIINKWIQIPIDLPHPTYNVAVNRNEQILVVGKSIWIYNQEGVRVKTIEVSEIE